MLEDDIPINIVSVSEESGNLLSCRSESGENVEIVRIEENIVDIRLELADTFDIESMIEEVTDERETIHDEDVDRYIDELEHIDD